MGALRLMEPGKSDDEGSRQMNDLKEQLQLQRYLEENGLYEKSFEHDNCGVGFVASFQGENSHRIVSMGLKAVACLTHRGAVDADMVTGDGAGIMIQIPKKLFATYIEDMGHRRPEEDSIGVGMIFFPEKTSINKICAAVSSSPRSWNSILNFMHGDTFP